LQKDISFSAESLPLVRQVFFERGVILSATLHIPSLLSMQIGVSGEKNVVLKSEGQT